MLSGCIKVCTIDHFQMVTIFIYLFCSLIFSRTLFFMGQCCCGKLCGEDDDKVSKKSPATTVENVDNIKDDQAPVNTVTKEKLSFRKMDHGPKIKYVIDHNKILEQIKEKATLRLDLAGFGKGGKSFKKCTPGGSENGSKNGAKTILVGKKSAHSSGKLPIKSTSAKSMSHDSSKTTRSGSVISSKISDVNSSELAVGESKTSNKSQGSSNQHDGKLVAKSNAKNDSKTDFFEEEEAKDDNPDDK